MSIEIFTELLSSVGFPIAALIVCALAIYKLWKQSAERTDKLMDELARSREANEKFAQTLVLVTERLSAIQSNLGKIEQDISDLKQKTN